MELYTLAQFMPGGVGTSDFESLGGDVGGVDLGAGQFFCEGQRDCARAGADVYDANVCSGRPRPLLLSLVSIAQTRKLQHRFDDMLRLGARDQYRGGHDQAQTPKLLMAGDVLGW